MIFIQSNSRHIVLTAAQWLRANEIIMCQNPNRQQLSASQPQVPPFSVGRTSSVEKDPVNFLSGCGLSSTWQVVVPH